jgi:hypothetical protein
MALSAGKYGGGSGTSGDPYQIATLAHLELLSATPDDWAAGIYFIQTASIDASATKGAGYNTGAGFLPIAFDAFFYGSYNGQNFTITGLYINLPTGNNVGLFSSSDGGTFSNIKLVNPEIKGTNNIAGLIGNAKNSTITSCEITAGTIQGLVISDMHCGGLIGASNASTITSCKVSDVTINCYSECGGLIGIIYNYGTPGNSVTSCVVTDCVIQGTYNIGGLIGKLYSYVSSQDIVTKCAVINSSIVSNGTSAGGLIGIVLGSTGHEPVISQCFSTGSVVGTGVYAYGGLIGEGYSFKVNDCYSMASVTGTNNAGGFVGFADPGSITNCYSTGLVTSSGSTVGGFISDNSGASTNCFWDTQTSGKSTSAGGGVGKTTAEMKTESTFTGWNFETIPVWLISTDNNGYPHLAWQALAPPKYSGGAGTSGDPYQIASLADLAELSATSADWAAGIYFIQTADIDASATNTWNDNGAGGYYGFIPIAFGFSFDGSYNGDNHTITGLYINRLGVANNMALFSSGNGIFLNIKLISPEIYGANATGGLIGMALGGSVTSCEVTGGTIQGSGSNCGGLIGYSSLTNITSCAVHGSAIQCAGEAESYGGLVGYASVCTVTSCEVTDGTTISTTDGGLGYYFGGLIGNAVQCTVSNCNINLCTLTTEYYDDEDEICGGLIGNSQEDIITSCEVKNVTINSFRHCGGLIGQSWSDLVTSCVVTDGAIYGTEYVGGLIGRLYSDNSGIVTKCAVINGDIQGVSDLGGLIGYLVGVSGGPVISQCFTTGTVIGTGGDSYGVGGLFGEGYTFNMTDCYSTASVTGPDYVGGLVGNIGGASITNCYSTGLVTCDGSFVGGFVGNDDSNDGIITNCFWDTETSGQLTSAGAEVGKTTAEMKTLGTFTDWDFTTVWHISVVDNNGYPHLAWQTFPAVVTWTGATTTDWNTAGNWSSSSVPVATDNVSIPNVTNDPVVTQTGSSLAVCNNLTIASGAVVTIATGKSLTVNGTLTNSAGVTGLVVNTGGSLIESTTGVSATVESAIPASQWHLISVPVSNATSNVFLDRYLQTHSESTNAYTDITPTNNTLTPMKGFALYGAGGFTASYTGALNTAAQSYSTTAATYVSPNGGWNLVGNPYPCSIDWIAASGWTKTNINNAIYVHKDASTWATFVGGTGANSGTRFIAPCQGFFVQATAAGTLAMTDAVRMHNATTFFKNTDAVTANLVRLEVSGNGYKDEAVVRFLPEATAEFDGQYDAHKFYGDLADAAQIYSIGSTPLSINSLPETNIVPVGVKAGVSGSYTIAATEINDLQYVTIEDTKTGIFTELANSPYTFSFEAGENELRFNLHFNTLLGIADKKDVSATVYSNQKTAYINLNNQVKGDIFIYNMAGQLVAAKLSAKGMNEIKLNALGNYIVKVVTDKTAQVKKIFIQ